MTAASKGSPAASLACNPDAGFVQWLATTGGSIAVSTYQAGKLLLIGWDGRKLTLLMRNYDQVTKRAFFPISIFSSHLVGNMVTISV